METFFFFICAFHFLCTVEVCVRQICKNVDEVSTVYVRGFFGWSVTWHIHNKNLPCLAECVRSFWDD